MNMQRPPTIKLRVINKNHRVMWCVGELIYAYATKCGGEYLVCCYKDECTHKRTSIMIDPNDIESDAYFMYNDISIHLDKTKPVHEFTDMISPYLEKYNVEKAIDKLD